jgi:hypothetical protein
VKKEKKFLLNININTCIYKLHKTRLLLGEEDYMEIDINLCPNCKDEDAYTYTVQEWVGKELMKCEDCDCLYLVEYEIKPKKITIK